MEPAFAPDFLPPVPPSRGLVHSLFLPLAIGVLGMGYLLMIPRFRVASGPQPRTIDLVLREPMAVELSPIASLANSPLPGAAGGSNREGNGARDPGLRADPLANRPGVEAPRSEVPVAPGAATELSLPSSRLVDLSLPTQVGGNGVSEGQGKGFGRGLGHGVGDGAGGAARPAAREVRIDQLTVIRQSIPRYVYKPGERFADTVVEIQIQLGLEGIPRELKVLRGEAKLAEQALKSVQDWRFHIPDHLRSEVPLALRLRFNFFKL